jgi:hypothetical protein
VVRNYLIPASFLDLWSEATRHDSGITLDIHSLNHDYRHLRPDDLALGYKQLQRLEEAWCTLKSELRVRPVSHWAVHRIHAHVVGRVLELWLERGIAQACGTMWRNIRANVDQRKLAPLLSPHGEIWQVTEPSPEASTPCAVSQRGGSISFMPALRRCVVIFHHCQRLTNPLGAVNQDCYGW